MASMVCASSSLNAQSSLVKCPRTTNSKYPRSSIWANPTYCVQHHNKIIFNSVKSYKYSFIQGEYGFSAFSLMPKISRVASSAKSPYFNTITAQHDHDHTPHQKSIYDYKVKRYGRDVNLIDEYKGKILLIVNIPYQGSEYTENVYNMLHDLRAKFQNRDPEFEILGFQYDKKETGKQGSGRGSWAINQAQFPLFDKVELNKTHNFRRWLNDEDLWYFLRNNEICGGGYNVADEFEMFLVDWEGIPVGRYPRWEPSPYAQDQADGGRPGPGISTLSSSGNIVEANIEAIYGRKKNNSY